MEEVNGKSLRREQEKWSWEKERLEIEVRQLRSELKDRDEARELANQLFRLSIREDEDIKWQIGALEGQLKNREKAVSLLKDRLKGSENLRAENGHTIARISQELRERRTQFHSQEEKMEDLEQRSLELEVDLRDKEAQISRLSATKGLKGSNLKRQLQSDLESQTKTIKELTVKLNSQERKILAAQESVIEMKMKNRREILDDNEIRLLLENELMDSTREWARKWAVQEIDERNTASNSTTLRRELEKVTEIGEGDMRQRLQGVPPQLVVNALLSQYISEHVFQCPFPKIGDEKASQQNGNDFPEMMATLYNSFLKVHETNAHVWRSQTLQLLSSVKDAEKSLLPGDDLKGKMEVSQTRHINTLVEGFLSGPYKYLLRNITESDSRARKNQLTIAIRNAGNLSSNLWKQRTSLTVRGFEYYNNIPFRIDSEVMEAHSFHKLGANDHRSDGEKVRMVIQPGFFVSGDENGGSYDKLKVWAKAVVILA